MLKTIEELSDPELAEEILEAYLVLGLAELSKDYDGTDSPISLTKKGLELPREETETMVSEYVQNKYKN